MKSSKRIMSFFLMVLVLSSCGNPHLVQDEAPLSETIIIKQDPLITENFNENAEKVISVENGLGEKNLNFGRLSKDQEIAKEIIITSKDDDYIPVFVRFEKGKHFYFNGGKFPGRNGNCNQSLKAKESCKLDISFDASVVGKFEDLLIITTKNGNEYRIPLYGERIESISTNNNNSHLTIGNLQLSTIDFGTINVGDISTKTLEIKNNYDSVIPIKSLTLNDKEIFKIIDKSNCQKEIRSGSCYIQISFEPTKATEIESIVTILEESGNKLEVLIKGKAVNQTKENKQTEALSIEKNSQDKIAESNRIKIQLERETLLAQERITLAEKTEQEALEKLKLAMLENEKKAEGQLQILLAEVENLKKEKNEASKKLEEAKRLACESKERQHEEAKSELKNCLSKNEITLQVAPKNYSMLATAVLPYQLSSRQTKQKLGLLYNNESNAKIKNADINIVSDALVVSTFLTEDKISNEIEDILLTLDLTKVETDQFNETEMICLSSQSVKKCSGRLFSLPDWLKLKNPDFFKVYKVPVTRTYENLLSQNVIRCGDHDCERMEKTISLKEILKLSVSEMDLLKKDKVIHIILTDDTRQTSSPKMIFKTKEAKECSGKLEQLSQKN